MPHPTRCSPQIGLRTPGVTPRSGRHQEASLIMAFSAIAALGSQVGERPRRMRAVSPRSLVCFRLLAKRAEDLGDGRLPRNNLLDRGGSVGGDGVMPAGLRARNATFRDGMYLQIVWPIARGCGGAVVGAGRQPWCRSPGRATNGFEVFRVDEVWRRGEGGSFSVVRYPIPLTQASDALPFTPDLRSCRRWVSPPPVRRRASAPRRSRSRAAFASPGTR